MVCREGPSVGRIRRSGGGGTFLAACVLAWAAFGLVACSREAPTAQARLSLEATLGGADTAGFAKALAPRPFVFPDDHGPHPRFRNEWWYVTGNLEGEGEREVGFQFTLFRRALSPDDHGGLSAWSTNQAYMGHLAVTDVTGERFHASERFARGAVGLAGARVRPFRVWLEDWTLEEADPGVTGFAAGAGEGPGGIFPLRLRAADGDVALDLILEAGKPPVLQGEDGLSRKGPEEGNASYYYSHTRMPTSGTVTFGADTLRVTGLSWMDREWSTSALSEGQVGWDWFALQLDHGWELMVYALRMGDGTAHPLSDGVLVDPRGRSSRLVWGRDITVTPRGSWTSSLDGSVYPSGWRVEIPGEGWALDVSPALADQELDLAFRYWEGAVRVEGIADGGPVTGKGYVELTGYAGRRPER